MVARLRGGTSGPGGSSGGAWTNGRFRRRRNGNGFTNGAPVLISAWQHGSWTAGLPPIGKGTIRVTASEAILDGKLFMGTAAGREMYEILSDLGGLAEWSWSLHDVKSSVGNWQGRPCRIITSVNVSEVSPVLKGAAGPGRSRTLAMKDGGIDPDQRADLERIRRQLTALTPAQRAEMAAIRARVSR